MLAAVRYDRGYDVDDLFLRVVEESSARGLRVGGVIQDASGGTGACAASVHAIDLRTGRPINIWQERGVCARGCRLDESRLVDVEAVLMAAISEPVDLLVINRYGRAESLGGGLIGCFAAAYEAGVPVLTAVRAPYREAWVLYHGGLAAEQAPDPIAITNWAVAASRTLEFELAQ